MHDGLREILRGRQPGWLERRVDRVGLHRVQPQHSWRRTPGYLMLRGQLRTIGVWAAASLFLAAAPVPTVAGIKASRIGITAALGESHQFVQADKQGHVCLLSSRTLQVFPLTAKGLGQPSPLKAKVPFDDVRYAAMGASGDTWLLLDGDLHL